MVFSCAPRVTMFLCKRRKERKEGERERGERLLFPKGQTNNSGIRGLRLCASEPRTLGFCRYRRVILLRVCERSVSLALQRSIMIARKKEWPDNTLDNLSTWSLLYSGEQLDNRKSIYHVTERTPRLFFPLFLFVCRQTEVLQTSNYTLPTRLFVPIGMHVRGAAQYRTRALMIPREKYLPQTRE